MSSKWSLTDILPPLEQDEVQLWRIDLECAPNLMDRYLSLLSAEEKIHAARLRIGRTQDHFVVGRACLRILLGNALGISPREINIAKGLHGKPETPVASGRSISFNVAHSKDTILIALGHGAIGVDVEHMDRSIDIMEISRANFTAEESNSLATIADPEIRLKAFYRYWTRKEAIAKADGRGLLLSLDSFDVSFESISSQPIRVNEPSSEQGKLYFVSDLDLGDRAMGALALESPECRIRRLLFPLTSSW
jgi:4'-phosphopantetheinyl transferase